MEGRHGALKGGEFALGHWACRCQGSGGTPNRAPCSPSPGRQTREARPEPGEAPRLRGGWRSLLSAPPGRRRARAEGRILPRARTGGPGLLLLPTCGSPLAGVPSHPRAGCRPLGRSVPPRQGAPANSAPGKESGGARLPAQVPVRAAPGSQGRRWEGARPTRRGRRRRFPGPRGRGARAGLPEPEATAPAPGPPDN